ncbi:29437_t:CDS:2, partial [Gigaspora margarita]
QARVNSKQQYKKEKEIKFFNMKDNSILPSNLIQTIYESLISILKIDENLEELLDFQECNFSECSIANHLIKNIQASNGYCYIYLEMGKM